MCYLIVTRALFEVRHLVRIVYRTDLPAAILLLLFFPT